MDIVLRIMDEYIMVLDDKYNIDVSSREIDDKYIIDVSSREIDDKYIIDGRLMKSTLLTQVMEELLMSVDGTLIDVID